jgi:serine protease AprX
MVYTVTARDAAGNVLGTTEESAAGSGTSSLFLDLRSIKNLAYGAFTFEIVGEMAVSDPDNLDSESLLGRVVVLQVAQLIPLR